LTCQSKWRANVANLTVVNSETRNVVVGAVTYQSTVGLPFLFSQFPKSFVQYLRPAHSRNSNGYFERIAFATPLGHRRMQAFPWARRLLASRSYE
jgi:hypothetical protein